MCSHAGPNPHTELEHTPKRNLYQQAMSRDSGFIVGVFGGLPLGVCTPGVCCTWFPHSQADQGWCRGYLEGMDVWILNDNDIIDV